MAGRPDELLAAATALAGADAVVAGNAASAVGDAIPAVVVSPTSVETLAAVLRWATERGLRVVPTGHGTKLDWGDLPAGIDVVLSTANLNAVCDHRHGDLTATVEAGATLAAVNAEFGRRSQWLPLDPFCPDAATIGGIVATNDSGPRRHRHGAPRDLIIGVTFARADGQLAKAGGHVVKNVAGYDLSKLLSGSFGSLGVIVSATFKLAPMPSTSYTLEAECHATEGLGASLQAILASQLTPSAVEIEGPPHRLLVRFESIDAAAERQAADATRLVAEHANATRILAGGEDAARWAAHAERPWSGPGAILKIGLLPTSLVSVLDSVQELIGARGADGEVVGRAGLGVLYLRLDASVSVQAGIVQAVRERLAADGGHAVVLRGSCELKASVGAWGPLGDAGRIMHAVKWSFDPAGLLSPGRWPLT